MGKKFSLYLKALIFFWLVSTSSFQFYWQNSKRKHGGGKIKEIGKIHVDHNFWRHHYCSQTVRQTAFLRGTPAQKTRTGTQLECSNTQGLQGWKRCQQAQALLTAMLWQCEGPHGPDVQSDSGVPGQLQPEVCIDWGVLHCSRAKTWLHTLASSQLLHIPTDSLVSTAEKLESGKGRMLWINKTLVWTGREVQYCTDKICQVQKSCSQGPPN